MHKDAKYSLWTIVRIERARRGPAVDSAQRTGFLTKSVSFFCPGPSLAALALLGGAALDTGALALAAAGGFFRPFCCVSLVLAGGAELLVWLSSEASEAVLAIFELARGCKRESRGEG